MDVPVTERVPESERLGTLSVETLRLEIVAEATVAVARVEVPATDRVEVAIIFPTIVCPIKVVEASCADP